MQAYLTFAFAVAVLWLARLYTGWRAAVNAIQNYPGLRHVFGPDNLLISPRIPYLSAGGFTLSSWRYKHQDFVRFNSDIISSVSWLPTPGRLLLLADADAIKEVTSHRTRFVKPLDRYKVLTFYGSNIIVTEGDEWRRHRKISAPSFSEKNNRLVWDETMLIVKELREKVWAGKQEISVDNVIDVTVPMALFILGVAAFGQRMSWVEDLTVPTGHSMTFKDALHIVSKNTWLKAVLPSWYLRWGPIPRIRDLRTAYEDLEKYMLEMIHQRKYMQSKDERRDLLSSLLNANDDSEDGVAKLSDSELMGNIFIYLVAGNESTAHTLAFTFIMLALYQDEQEKLYQQIMSVVPEDRIPGYEEMGKFTYSMAVFMETLRMFPPIGDIFKRSEEDTVFLTQNMAGEKLTVPCPKGTNMLIHMPGLHYNTRYWEDPYAFKPSRFLGDWPRDAFLPFSGGARSCLGRRFSETEGVAILTYIIKHYRVDVVDDPQYAQETFEQTKARLLVCERGITMYPVKAPLVFKRR